MSNIQLFDFNNNEVRVINKDGAPWFVLKDIAGLLGIGRTNDVVRMLDDDEKGADSIRTPGGVQKIAIVNEAGLYSLILRSRKPEAKQFKRWVTHKVLPAIRKHGGYLTVEKVEEALLNPDTLIRLATNLKEERAKNFELQEQIAADKPKTVFADAVSASKTSILVGELAKLLRQNGIEVGQQRLFAWLREKGYLIRASRSDWNMPTQRSVQLGWFEIKETAITHSDGHVTVSKTPKVTGKGQQYFINLFLSGKAVI